MDKILHQSQFSNQKENTNLNTVCKDCNDVSLVLLMLKAEHIFHTHWSELGFIRWGTGLE